MKISSERDKLCYKIIISSFKNLVVEEIVQRCCRVLHWGFCLHRKGCEMKDEKEARNKRWMFH
jgi:hypothetical protein